MISDRICLPEASHFESSMWTTIYPGWLLVFVLIPFSDHVTSTSICPRSQRIASPLMSKVFDQRRCSSIHRTVLCQSEEEQSNNAHSHPRMFKYQSNLVDTIRIWRGETNSLDWHECWTSVQRSGELNQQNCSDQFKSLNSRDSCIFSFSSCPMTIDLDSLFSSYSTSSRREILIKT